jgi:hypothetical protein
VLVLRGAGESVECSNRAMSCRLSRRFRTLLVAGGWVTRKDVGLAGILQPDMLDVCRLTR